MEDLVEFFKIIMRHGKFISNIFSDVNQPAKVLAAIRVGPGQ